MPLFTIEHQTINKISQTNFDSEKDLQDLIENNLEAVFNCKLVATEFPTGAIHAGRIDTLALSEENNPVIIEYKKIESSELINQSLYYLSWINDHRGDFEIAVQKKLGGDARVDWSDIRVICIAPNYRKYDLYAVQVMGANIELWTYRLFENYTLYLEEVFRKSYQEITTTDLEGRQVAIPSAREERKAKPPSIYTFEQHLKGKPENIRELAMLIQEFITGLDPSIEEVPKKFYIAYRISQNIVCMEIQKHRVLLYLKLVPKLIEELPAIARDVTNIGHYGTGDLEVSLKTLNDLEVAKLLINMAYQKVGG